MIQSILIPIDNYTLTKAKKWLKDHGYKTTYQGKQVHETEHYHRFRQAEPKKMKYRTFTVPHTYGIKFIIGYKEK